MASRGIPSLRHGNTAIITPGASLSPGSAIPHSMIALWVEGGKGQTLTRALPLQLPFPTGTGAAAAAAASIVGPRALFGHSDGGPRCGNERPEEEDEQGRRIARYGRAGRPGFFNLPKLSCISFLGCDENGKRGRGDLEPFFFLLSRFSPHGKPRLMVPEPAHGPRNPRIPRQWFPPLRMSPAGPARTKRPTNPAVLPRCLRFFPAVSGAAARKNPASHPGLPSRSRYVTPPRPTGAMPARGLGPCGRECEVPRLHPH